MNKDFWERVNKLEELADKATQGEWSVDDTGCVYRNPQGSSEEGQMPIVLLGRTGKQADQGILDAAFIAAANPAMILEMIATFKGRLSFLEHELVEKDIELENTKAELKRLEKEVDWLAEKCACQNIRNGCQCGIDKNYRRNEARKAVTEADNA